MPHSLTGIPGVDWGDTFVLGWRVEQNQLIFDVLASLSPGHPAYDTPPPEDWTCYRTAQLIFEGVRKLSGLKSMNDVRPTNDPDGSADYDTFDSIMQNNDESFRLIGTFGDVCFEASDVSLVFNNREQ